MWKNFHLAPIYNAKFSMYCDIKPYKMEKYSLIFHFSHHGSLYSGKQDKYGAEIWKIFICINLWQQ